MFFGVALMLLALAPPAYAQDAPLPCNAFCQAWMGQKAPQPPVVVPAEERPAPRPTHGGGPPDEPLPLHADDPAAAPALDDQQAPPRLSRRMAKAKARKAAAALRDAAEGASLDIVASPSQDGYARKARRDKRLLANDDRDARKPDAEAMQPDTHRSRPSRKPVPLPPPFPTDLVRAPLPSQSPITPTQAEPPDARSVPTVALARAAPQPPPSPKAEVPLALPSPQAVVDEHPRREALPGQPSSLELVQPPTPLQAPVPTPVPELAAAVPHPAAVPAPAMPPVASSGGGSSLVRRGAPPGEPYHPALDTSAALAAYLSIEAEEMRMAEADPLYASCVREQLPTLVPPHGVEAAAPVEERSPSVLAASVIGACRTPQRPAATDASSHAYLTVAQFKALLANLGVDGQAVISSVLQAQLAFRQQSDKHLYLCIRDGYLGTGDASSDHPFVFRILMISIADHTVGTDPVAELILASLRAYCADETFRVSGQRS